MIYFFLLLLFAGCQREISEDDFLENTNFNKVIIDFAFKDSESHDDFSTTYDIKNIEYKIVNYSNLYDNIENYEYFEPNQELNLPFESNTNNSYVLIPLYSTWIIRDIDSTYGFDDGNLNINLMIQPSDMPTTDIKLVIIEINSQYEYNVEISMNE